MYEIIDKLLLFLCSIVFYLLNFNNSYAIIPVIIVIVISSLITYFDNDWIRLAGLLIFTLLCLIFPTYIVFLPILIYDMIRSKYQIAVAVVPIIMIVLYPHFSLVEYLIMLILISFAILLKHRTDRLNTLKSEYNDLRDNTTHMSLLLQEQNRNLIQNQDNEINLATLNERNRISRELHDSIGHMLSRALLQVGALLTVSQEEATKEGLTALKESLSEGMNQIRSTIHQMYDESIDLFLQIDSLVKDFTFCPINYEYDISNSPELPLRQSIIAITKEALANIMQHSDATRVSILLREHPAMYQLIIRDNGTITEEKSAILSKAFEKQEFGEGLGLQNISNRVKSFNGFINISTENGFQLFISFPRKMDNK